MLIGKLVKSAAKIVHLNDYIFTEIFTLCHHNLAYCRSHNLHWEGFPVQMGLGDALVANHCPETEYST